MPEERGRPLVALALVMEDGVEKEGRGEGRDRLQLERETEREVGEG